MPAILWQFLQVYESKKNKKEKDKQIKKNEETQRVSFESSQNLSV